MITGAMTTPTVRQQWIELIAVVCIGVLPDLYQSTIIALGFEPTPETFAETAVFVLLRSLWVSVPVLYLIHRSGDRAAAFGLVRPRWTDLPIAVLVVVGNVAAAGVVAQPCRPTISPPQDPAWCWRSRRARSTTAC